MSGHGTSSGNSSSSTSPMKYWILEDPVGIGLDLFLIQVVLIIVIVRVLGKLLQKIRQPMVIGEIIAGILLGPSAFGQIPGFTDAVFPKASLAYLSLFANIGLIFFMFFLGLEVEPKLMKKSWKTSLPIALLSIIIPFCCGLGLSQWIKSMDTDRTNHDSTSFMLFVGIAMAFTAFPVLARILTSANLINSRFGMQALACAAIDDVLAWCCLALVLSYANGGGAVKGVYVAILAIVFILSLAFIVHPILQRIHNRLLASGKEMDRNFIAFLLLMLCICSWFADILGIHAFFGAFAFGIVVPKGGTLVNELAPKIELLIVEFFLPLYFAYSGLGTDITSLSSGEAWAAVVAVTAIAAIGKIGPTMLMARLLSRCKKSWRWCLALGVMMNTRGLVALIALNIGKNSGILGVKSFTIFVIMSLVTTFASSPLLYHLYEKKYHEELAKAAALIVKQEQAKADEHEHSVHLGDRDHSTQDQNDPSSQIELQNVKNSNAGSDDSSATEISVHSPFNQANGSSSDSPNVLDEKEGQPQIRAKSVTFPDFPHPHPSPSPPPPASSSGAPSASSSSGVILNMMNRTPPLNDRRISSHGGGGRNSSINESPKLGGIAITGSRTYSEHPVVFHPDDRSISTRMVYQLGGAIAAAMDGQPSLDSNGIDLEARAINAVLDPSDIEHEAREAALLLVRSQSLRHMEDVSPANRQMPRIHHESEYVGSIG